jgi:tRNA U34 5-carboxymethylaminomethyl modifying GTPase MnmE/TrmE
MSAKVCVLTGKGYGAISSILLYGPDAEAILKEVFVSAGNGTTAFQTGGIFHGQIVENGQTIDHIVIGCEEQNRFAVHCHGNPLLVRKIVQLFVRYGAQVETIEPMIRESTAWATNNTIEREAYVEQLKAVTMEGVKIIQSQIGGGLSAMVKGWLNNSVSIEKIREQCREILNRSQIARRIIHGVKIILAGPANSGKSTLLNTLAGSQKALVSDIAGTTRDWVSVLIHTGPLRAEIVDTAGLGREAVHHSVDGNAQQRTLELVRECDCVLWIEDCSIASRNVRGGSDRGPAEVDGRYREPAIHLTAFGGCHPMVIRVLNKSDLRDKSPKEISGAVSISAKTGDGIENLLNEIQGRLQVCDFDCTLPVVFTARQEKLLTAIVEAREKTQLRKLLTEAIDG